MIWSAVPSCVIQYVLPIPLLVYVEDHGEQGYNQNLSDEFWSEVKDGDGAVVLEVNGPSKNLALGGLMGSSFRCALARKG